MEYAAAIHPMEERTKKSGDGLRKECREARNPLSGRVSCLLTAVGVLACAAFVIYGMRAGLFSSQEEMARFISRFGIAGPSVFAAIQAVQVVVPIVPGGITCLVGVLLFGPVWGFLYNYVGICIGSAMAFLISRRLGMSAVERAAGNQKIGRYLKWMENGTFDRLFALAIFFPVAPDDLLCFLAGVTRMSFRKFLLIILLGKPLSIALYSLGLQLVFGQILRLLG